MAMRLGKQEATKQELERQDEEKRNYMEKATLDGALHALKNLKLIFITVVT